MHARINVLIRLETTIVAVHRSTTTISHWIDAVAFVSSVSSIDNVMSCNISRNKQKFVCVDSKVSTTVSKWWHVLRSAQMLMPERIYWHVLYHS